MKEKLIEKLKEFGPITGVLLVSVVAIFTINGITGFNPGGVYAPGGEKAVGEEKSSDSGDAGTDSDGTGQQGVDPSSVVGGGSQTITTDGSGGSIGFDEQGNPIPGNNTGLDMIGGQGDDTSIGTSPDADQSAPQ